MLSHELGSPQRFWSRGRPGPSRRSLAGPGRQAWTSIHSAGLRALWAGGGGACELMPRPGLRSRVRQRWEVRPSTTYGIGAGRCTSTNVSL
eukprot:3730866-Pyramimonas_sp.AAC.1